MKERKFKSESESIGKDEETRSRSSKRGRSKSSRGRNNYRDRDNNVRGASKNSNVGTRKSANDVTWYTKTPEQVANAANISFMNALGQNVQVFPNINSNIQTSAPGVMRLGFIPTFGNPQVPSDAMNTAARKVYQFIRNYNSGSTNYEAPDLMKYFMLMDSAYAYAGFLIRTYGLINSYSAANRFWPETFFIASGVNFNDLKRNIAAFRTAVINYIAKVNSMVVPGTLPIFQRHFWMASNVYKDSDSFWSQTYIYVPEVYAQYDKETADVRFRRINALNDDLDNMHLLSYRELISIANTIIDSIALNEDFNTMAGDVLKAYQGNVFRIEGITAEYVLYPVYDPGVLNQMMNARALGYLTKLGDRYTVSDEPNELVYALHEDVDTHAIQLVQYDTVNATHPLFFKALSTGNLEPYIATLRDRKYLINLTVENVTPLHVIESTRMTATSTLAYTESGGAYNILDTCGADIITTFTIYHFDIASNGELKLAAPQPFTSDYFMVDPTTYTRLSRTMMYNMIELASFDWHPTIQYFIPFIDAEGVDHGPFALPPYVDLYRTALTTADVLSNIHDVANLSLFNVTLTNPIQG